jgi:hypothetical protein
MEKHVKHLHMIEQSMQKVWILEGRQWGLQFLFHLKYKQIKSDFRNACDNLRRA